MNRRQLQIVRAVADAAIQDRACTVSDVRQMTRTSLATVYNDLEALARLRVVRSKGAIEFHEDEASTVPERTAFRPALKAAIAGRVVQDVVKPGSVLYLDSGTTCYEVARELVRQRRSDVKVITSNPHALAYLMSANVIADVVCLGGSLRSAAASLHGTLTTTALKAVTFDTALISVDFLHSDSGMSLATFSEAELAQKQIACEQATSTVCIVADDSKVGRNLGHIFTSVSAIASRCPVCVAIGTEEHGLSPGVLQQVERAVGRSGGRVLVARLEESLSQVGHDSP